MEDIFDFHITGETLENGNFKINIDIKIAGNSAKAYIFLCTLQRLVDEFEEFTKTENHSLRGEKCIQ